MRKRSQSSPTRAAAMSSHTTSHARSQNKSYAKDCPSTVPSKLCSFCQELVDIEWPSASGEQGMVATVHYSHHPTDDELKRSSENGCAFCTQVLLNPMESYLLRDRESLRNQAGTIEPFPTTSFVRLLSFTGTASLRIYFFIGSGDSWSGYMANGVDVSSSNATSSLLFSSSRSSEQEDDHPYCPSSILDSKTKSNMMDGLSLARQWYRTCLDSHGEQCHDRQSLGVTPTRLLKVEESPPRLCLGRDLDRDSPFAALSHCWGSLQFTTLKTDNYQQFLDKIPQSALTKTFLDACYVTRALGLRYLWIDLLCIIQDSEADWLAESAMMSNVYGSAELTITASGALDGSEGCFIDRADTWKCEVSVQMEGKKHHMMIVPPSFIFSKRLERMPLESRVWTLQESVLSRRILNFTKAELFWQCSAAMCCETFPYPISFMEQDNMPRHLQGNQLSSSFEATWATIIGRYTKRNLSNPRDKLVAIAGLAQMVQKRYQQEGNSYVVGLWRESLEVQLLWHLEEPDGKPPGSSSRPSQYRAPSWSWASIEGGGSIMLNTWPAHPTGKRQVFIKIHDAILDLFVTENPFGEVKYAALNLLCTPLLLATIQQAPLLLERGNTGPYFLDIPGDDIQQDEWLVWIDVPNDTFSTPTETVSVYGLHIAGGEALLLQPTGNRQGEYKRIGMMSTFGNSPNWRFISAEAYTRNASDYVEIVFGENRAGEASDMGQTGFSTPRLNHLLEMNYRIILV